MKHLHWWLLVALVALDAQNLSTAQSGLRGDLSSSAMVIDVQVTQAISGDVIARAAMGAVISAEGYVLSTADAFSETEASSGKGIRTRIRGWIAANPRARIDLQVVAVDHSVNVALLRLGSSDRKETQSVAQTTLSQTELKPLRIDRMPLPGESISAVTVQEGSVFALAPGKVVSQRVVSFGPDSRLASGAPVIDKTGKLVALISARAEDGTYIVVPISNATSLLQAIRLDLPLSLAQSASTLKTRADVFRISEVQDAHELGTLSVPFDRVYNAPQGYRIVDTQFLTNSANGLTRAPSIRKSADEKSVLVQFELSSGPARDPWRGWLEGELRVQLAPER